MKEKNAFLNKSIFFLILSALLFANPLVLTASSGDAEVESNKKFEIQRDVIIRDAGVISKNYTKPIFAKSKPELVADQRCNSDYIKRLKAKESCLKFNIITSCMYLGAIGIGASVGVYYNMSQGIKLQHANPKLLEGFKDMYDKTEQLNVDLKRIRNIIKQADHQVLVDILSQKGLNIIEINTTTFYDSRFYDKATEINKRLGGKDTINQTDYMRAFNTKVISLLQLDENKQVKRLLTDLTTSHELDSPSDAYELAKRKALTVAQQYLETNYGTEFKQVTTEIANVKQEAETNPKKFYRRNSNSDWERQNDRADAISKNLQRRSPLARIFFDLVFVGSNFLDFNGHYPSTNRGAYPYADGRLNLDKVKGEYEEAHSKINIESVKLKARQGVVKGGAASAVGTIALDVLLNTLDMAAHDQVASCAKELNLSEKEIPILQKSVQINGIATSCDNITIKNFSDLLIDSQIEFGFVPKGICELVINQDKELDLLSKYPAKMITCDEVAGENYKLTRESFECNVQGIKYIAPLGKMGLPDFSTVKATDLNGKLHPMKADKLASKFKITDQYGTPISAPQETHFSSCTAKGTKKIDVLCFCILSSYAARANRTAAKGLKDEGNCSTKLSEAAKSSVTSQPSSKNQVSGF